MTDVGEADAFGHRHKANVGEALADELARADRDRDARLGADLRPAERRARLDRLDGRDDVRQRRDGPGRERGHRADGRDPGRQVRPHRRCPTRPSGRARSTSPAMYNVGALPAALRRQARRPDAAGRARLRGRRELRPGSALEAGQRPDRPGERRHVVVAVAAARSGPISSCGGEGADRQARRRAGRRARGRSRGPCGGARP